MVRIQRTDDAPFFSHRGTTHTGYIGILIICSLFFLISFYFINQSYRMAESVMTTEQTKLAEVKELNLMSKMAGIHIRSYFLTGEDFYLEERLKRFETYYKTLVTSPDLMKQG